MKLKVYTTRLTQNNDIMRGGTVLKPTETTLIMEYGYNNVIVLLTNDKLDFDPLKPIIVEIKNEETYMS